MKKSLYFFLVASCQVLAQTEIKYSENFFVDNISYTSEARGNQKINIYKYNVSKDPKRTVIYLHGCGGLREHSKEWIRQLTDWNYNVIVIDSYTTRGMPNGACTTWAYLKNPPDDRVEDLFAAATWVKEQPWNKGLPAAIGFSHGGGTIYVASGSPKARELLSSGVSFYPWCWHHVRPRNDFPIQIHVGSEDEWSPAATCISNERRQNRNLEFYLYRGVHHGWDMPGVDTAIPAVVVGTTGVANKRLKYDAEANQLSRQSTRRWFEENFR